MKKQIQAILTLAFYLACTLLGTFNFKITANAEGGPLIKLHYHRDDGNYAPWDVWFWEAGKDGSGYAFEEENGEYIASFNVTPGTMEVGYIVRTQDWTKDVDKDQFIDISEIVSGTVHIFVESGVEGYAKEYGDDCIIGVKLKTARYDGDKTIDVKMTAEIPTDFSLAFKLNRKNKEIDIEEVIDCGDGLYKIKLDESLEIFSKYTITYEETDYNVIMPIIYSTDEFEKEYTYTGNDLGYTYSKEKTSFRVWAPTAEAVSLKRFESGTQAKSDLIEEIAMTKSEKGTWVCEVAGDLNGTYYVYNVTIDGNSKTAADPYARSSGANGKRSMVLDLESTNPEDWGKDSNPFEGESIADAIIYEGHIRDLTVGNDNGITNQGKYLGVVETGTTTASGISTGLDHMKELGITHLHVLPMYDFGSVDESAPGSNAYNWGYDPVNFNIPEGSYATDPFNGEVRVKEAKAMVKGLHDSGIAVVMDVVYNHVYNAEGFCINQIVPGYFSRITEDGTYSGGSGCGNDTATERSMVRKYIVDSVNYWADEYHIDGFRFDLVGLMDTDLINEIVRTVHEKHPNVIFYGEGWTMSTLVTKENITLATQQNSQLTPGFAYFNDTMRDGLKGSVFNTESGFVSGASGFESKIARCFMGADNWCKSPVQAINYASCHDNNTLFDRIRISNPDASFEDAIKMNNLAASIYILAEGTPFMQAGEEILRSKTKADGTYDHNSYSSGDEVNKIDWSSLEDQEYRNVFEYYKGLINFRKNHPILRLTDASLVEASFAQINTAESHMVSFEIKGGDIDKDMYIVFNANNESKDINLPAGNWNVYINGETSGVIAVDAVEGTAVVQPLSALVLVKEEASLVEKTPDELKDEKSGSGRGRALAGGAVAAAVCAGAALFAAKKKKK
ncbi:MAG: type I pullulanase [Lachnospiraceae bacterium]|nr:type I pullulanase [Lachnospiraceae bacterium]